MTRIRIFRGPSSSTTKGWPASTATVGCTSGDDVNIDEATRKTLALAIDDLKYCGDRRQAILNLNDPALI